MILIVWMNILNKVLAEEFELLIKYQNFLEFQALNDRVFIPYWKKGAIRSEKEKEALKKLFQKPLFPKTRKCTFFSSTLFLF